MRLFYSVSLRWKEKKRKNQISKSLYEFMRAMLHTQHPLYILSMGCNTAICVYLWHFLRPVLRSDASLVPGITYPRDIFHNFWTQSTDSRDGERSLGKKDSSRRENLNDEDGICSKDSGDWEPPILSSKESIFYSYFHLDLLQGESKSADIHIFFFFGK